MKKLILFFIIFCLLSCQQKALKTQLVEIDSLANSKGDLVAIEKLEEIIPESIDDEECLAYYWLLKMRTEIRLQKKIQSAIPLDYSITYYKKHNEQGKLARAYSYQAYILDNIGDTKQAILSLKNAEAIVKDLPHELLLANMIYSNLGRINHKVKEMDLSIDYSKKALRTAYLIGNTYYIAYALMNIYVDYNDVGNQDSAKYYIEKCIKLVENIPKGEKSGFYANIGNHYINQKDYNNAEKYLRLSLETSDNPYAYKGLAHIYYKRGEREKAEEMWAKALQTDNLYLKTDVLQALYESQQETGNYKDACETAMRIAMLKDSINQKQRDEDIRGLQELSELRRQKDIEKERFIMAMSFAGAFLMLALALTAYLFYLNARKKEDLKKTQEHLEKYRNQLKVLEKEGKKDTKEVERLTQKISELQARQNSQLQNGRERYEDIMADGTTVRWSRNDFADCIEYYRTIDMAFIVHMEQDYKHLSDKYILFAILEHLGKTDEQLQHIMAISQNTVRSYRSRINSASLTPSC